MALKMTANELELQTNYYKFIAQKRRDNTRKPQKNPKKIQKFQKTRPIKMDKARKKKKKKLMMDTFLLN